MSGKQLSLFSKIFAGAWVGISFVIFSILKWKASQTMLTFDEVSAILEQGVYFALLFSPVDISMWIQNVRGDRARSVLNENNQG